jgi:hypothetical protein
MGRRNGFALAATVWGAVFTLVSVYWGLGGRIGVEQLGATIQDEVARGEASFWLVFWLGATAKAVWTAIGWGSGGRVGASAHCSGWVGQRGSG